MIGAFALAFACAFAWAGLDVFRKQLSAAITPLPLVVLLNVGLLPVFAIWWLIAGGTITDFGAYAAPGGAALGLQVIANLLFLSAVRASPLSLTIPFLALTPVFASFVAWAMLGERPGLVPLLGIAAVVGGALALSSVGPKGRPRLLRVFVSERGAWMMTGVALCWGVSMVLDKRALDYAAVPVHALVQLTGLVAVVLGWVLISGRARELAGARAHLGKLGLATVTGAAAFGLQLVAVQYVLVSQLETIKRAIGLVSAIVLGQLVFGEAITRIKLLTIAVMIAGVAALMWGGG